ncbi:MAG: AsmA family protein, partial [Pseudomonadota bacterium]
MRWIFRLLGIVVLLVVLGIGALFVLPTERIAALATDQFEKATGRALTLSGEVRPTLWPELGVRTGPVTLANAEWSENGPMLEADGLSIGVDTAALWGGAVRVREVELIAPTILLERRADGTGNWEFGTSAAEGPTGATSSTETAPQSTGAEAPDRLAVSLDKAAITNGRIIYLDYGLDARTEVSAINGTAQLDDLNGPAAIEVTGQVRGQSVAITASVDALETFLSNGATGLEASGKIGGSTFVFDGRAGLTPLAAGGAINVELVDQAAVFGLIGASAPDLPQGLGREIRAEGDLTYTETGVTLRNAAIKLDDNVLSGDIDVTLADRPKITASLSAGNLNFSSLAPPPTEGGTSAATTTAEPTAAGWPTDRIDVSALQAVDADISLDDFGVDLGRIVLGRTRALINLDRGRAVTDIVGIEAYGGKIGGSFVVNSRGGLSARTNLTASSVAIQPLLQDLAGYNRLIAEGDVTLNILAIGDTVDALMRSLDGDMAMAFG